jgi:hypothetical protein
MNEYYLYSCIKGLFVCKRVTLLTIFSSILLTLWVSLCSATNVFANPIFNSSYGTTVVKLTSRKIKKTNIRTERHKEFMTAETSNDDHDLMDDQDNPDYSFNWVSIIKYQPIKNQTNCFQHLYYYPYSVYKWSIIRC